MRFIFILLVFLIGCTDGPRGEARDKGVAPWNCEALDDFVFRCIDEYAVCYWYSQYAMSCVPNPKVAP